MSFAFAKGFAGPVKNVTIYVAVFSLHHSEYREGPRRLSQTISFSPDQSRIEDVTYSGNGTVHLREIITVGADLRQSILERYKPDGELRDRWCIQYDRDGRRASAQRYGADGRLLSESLAQPDQPVEGEEPEDSSTESIEREFDAYGNWIREIRFQRSVEDGKGASIPTMATYRTITYFQI